MSYVGNSMARNELFFDSYAILELLAGNRRYSSYMKYGVVLTKLNLFEVAYKLLKLEVPNVSDFLKDYSRFSVDFDSVIIEEAAKFRLKFKERNLSMVDCIGYVIALTRGIQFLTGDKQFADLPNVEFVR